MDEVNDLNNEKILKKQAIENELKKNVAHYRTLMNFLGANLPIECMCLPKEIEKILIREGLIRIYDLIGHDLTKINGLGNVRVGILESRLDEFLVVQI